MTKAGLFLAFVAGLVGGLGGGWLFGLVPRPAQPVLRESVVRVPAEQASARAEGLSARQIYRRDGPGVVYLVAGSASGSGFVISKRGDLLTNAHVVGDNREVEVTLSDQRQLVGRVIARDRSRDVALVRLQNPPKNLRVLRLGSSKRLHVGDLALAIGNPFGLEQTLTVGVISALGRSITGLDGYTISGVIQTDAAINPGNSGGPLLNDRGEVVGINTQILTGGGDSKGSVGIGFAVPIDAVRREISTLRRGQVDRPAWLGVSGLTVTPAVRSKLRLPASVSGVAVNQVIPRSPAARVGLRKGEVITQLDDKPIRNVRELVSTIAAHRPGERLRLTVRNRSGQTRELNATLNVRPAA